MKMLKNLRNRLRKNMTNNERGQGATEYILLLTVLVAMVVMFKDKIRTQFDKKVGELSTQMEDATK